MLVHWEVLFRHFIKSVSHAGQALGWHFVNNTWFGSIFVELQNPECKYVG